MGSNIYYLFLIVCGAHCKTCQRESECSSCDPGFFLFLKNTSCVDCNSQFFKKVNNIFCSELTEDCIEYSSEMVCVKCMDDFFLTAEKLCVARVYVYPEFLQLRDNKIVRLDFKTNAETLINELVATAVDSLNLYVELDNKREKLMISAQRDNLTNQDLLIAFEYDRNLTKGTPFTLEIKNSSWILNISKISLGRLSFTLLLEQNLFVCTAKKYFDRGEFIKILFLS
jgi:hypothetical protein